METDPSLQEELEKAEERYAENPEGRVFAQLADLYRKAGDYDQALAIIDEGLKHHPEYLSAHIVRGRVYLDREEGEKAYEAFSEVLELDGENLVGLRTLGDLARERGDEEEARRWYGRLLRLDPMNEEVQGLMSELTGEDVDEIGEKARRAGMSAEKTQVYWDADVKEAMKRLDDLAEGEPAESPEEPEEEVPVEDATGSQKAEELDETKEAVERLREKYPDEEEPGEAEAEEFVPMDDTVDVDLPEAAEPWDDEPEAPTSDEAAGAELEDLVAEAEAGSFEEDATAGAAAEPETPVGTESIREHLQSLLRGEATAGAGPPDLEG